MNTSDGARKPDSQTTNMSTEPLLGAGGAVNYAIALQQYHFQQSLASQQLLAQQQAVAQAVSIKAATEQAAARAAEISRLLKGETGDALKEKIEEPSSKREKSVSHSRSPSPSHSSKSKSASPIRYRNGRNECEQYSPRDRRNYRSLRNPRYYSRGYNDGMDYSRSSYRRDADRSRGRHHAYGRRSTSRSRRRSTSRSLSQRYHHEPCFPSPRHVRPPSPESDRRTPDRSLNEHSMSRNPINHCSISSSPQRSRTRSPRKPTSRSLSANSQSHSDDDGNRSKNNNASGVGLKHQVKEASPSEEQSMQSSHSNPSCRSEFTSMDYSIKKTKLEQRSEKAGTSEIAFADGDRSSSTSSESMVVRRRSQDHVNPKGHFSSPEYSHSDHRGRNNKAHTFSDKRVTKDKYPSKVHAGWNLKLKNGSEHKLPPKVISSKEEESPCSLDTVTNERSMKSEIDCKNCSEDVITAEDAVNDCNIRTKQQATSHGVKIFEEQPNVSGGHVAHPLLKSNENIHGNCMLPNSPDEINHDHEYDTRTPAMLTDGSARKDAEPAMGSPTVCIYPQERSKKRSSSRERRKKHRRKSHRRHRREDSEEDDEHGKDGKLRRHRRKNNRKHHRSHKERKRGKRKYGETSPSSSSEDSSSSDDNYGKEYGHVPSKRSTNSSKRRHALSIYY
ncbi:uncharacterized protein LOC131248050 [Magnolia sinica]|uniref:uncharacterized protein LOC131248050 n=1 Tax=Magnolia sinica TaxID=86752 RepID=UPI0026599BF4|nr:uncharacterized protein LOC131248050 [Magnolia sinica]